MTKSKIKTLILVSAGLAILVALGWRYLQKPTVPENIASGNGRLEATQVDITTKYPGRLAQVKVKEGDDVEAGQELASMDLRELNAEMRHAQAQVTQAQKQRSAATAVISQRKSEVTLAEKNLVRARELYENQNIPIEQLQRNETAVQTARAAHRAALAELAFADATIDAARAQVESVSTRIDESILKSPLGGRILYRLAEPGEVLQGGGKVLTLLDLTDAFMTIFLPSSHAGRLRIGDEARIVLDAMPEYIIPAEVSFVSPEAQFTPKEVETRTEREKLVFRVKVQIDHDVLLQHGAIIKSGVPGVAYVRLGKDAVWPDSLQVRLPP